MQNEIILGEIMDKKKIWESYRFPLILLGGIILGAILGAILGEKATVLAIHQPAVYGRSTYGFCFYC